MPQCSVKAQKCCWDWFMFFYIDEFVYFFGLKDFENELWCHSLIFFEFSHFKIERLINSLVFIIGCQSNVGLYQNFAFFFYKNNDYCKLLSGSRNIFLKGLRNRIFVSATKIDLNNFHVFITLKAFIINIIKF